MDLDMKKMKWCPECRHVVVENEEDKCTMCKTKLIYPIPPHIAPLPR